MFQIETIQANRQDTYNAEIRLDLTVCSCWAMDQKCGIEEAEHLVEKENEDQVLDVAQAWVIEIYLDYLCRRAGQYRGDRHV